MNKKQKKLITYIAINSVLVIAIIVFVVKIISGKGKESDVMSQIDAPMQTEKLYAGEEVKEVVTISYFVNDVMSPLEALLEMPKAEGGLGWTSSDYGFFSGSGSFINVFLLMLFFSGLILDKMGIRFTGVLACSLMVLGTLLKYYAVTTDFGTSSVAFFGTQLIVFVLVCFLWLNLTPSEVITILFWLACTYVTGCPKSATWKTEIYIFMITINAILWFIVIIIITTT